MQSTREFALGEGERGRRDGGARLRRTYRRPFVAYVDKYNKMSSLRDSSGCRGFQMMIIMCPLSSKELLHNGLIIYRPLLSAVEKVYTSICESF